MDISMSPQMSLFEKTLTYFHPSKKIIIFLELEMVLFYVQVSVITKLLWFTI